MPDFSVIEGGGGGRESFEQARGRQSLQTLIIEILRAVARGDDAEGRVLRALIAFYDRAGHVPVVPMLEGAIAELHERAIAHDPFDDGVEAEQQDIIQAALRVAAESMASDGAARGRKGKREEALRSAIVRQMVAHEKRARANGWSYTEDLMTRWLGPWTPPTRMTSSKSPPKKAKQRNPR